MYIRLGLASRAAGSIISGEYLVWATEDAMWLNGFGAITTIAGIILKLSPIFKHGIYLSQLSVSPSSWHLEGYCALLKYVLYRHARGDLVTGQTLSPAPKSYLYRIAVPWKPGWKNGWPIRPTAIQVTYGERLEIIPIPF